MDLLLCSYCSDRCIGRTAEKYDSTTSYGTSNRRPHASQSRPNPYDYLKKGKHQPERGYALDVFVHIEGLGSVILAQGGSNGADLESLT